MSTNNDLYSMSDEDFMNANPSALFAAADTEAPSEPSSVSDDQPETGSEVLDETTDINEDDTHEGSEPESEEELEEAEASTEGLDDPDTDDEIAEHEGDAEPLDGEDLDGEEEPSDESELVQNPSTSKEYEEVMKPLKHRGTEFTPKNVEEVRRLMSMGLDYSRKMQGMKEQRKLLKMLDNNKLLDESKLTFAIDLINGNKDAIAQLVRDHKVDTLELEEDGKYTPSNYSVSDSEVELDDVVDSIRSTPTFADTMATVGNWDESSKRELAQKPQLLSALNEHKANGLYAMVQAEVERERSLGGLFGLSDYEAYVEMGNRMNRAGRFNEQQEPPKAPAKKFVRKTQPTAAEKQLQEKRRKAIQEKPSKPKKTPDSYDFWNMSDEEFEKFKF